MFDVWPSGMKFEAEVVAMTAGMLGSGAAAERGDEIVGTVTSGGTESIIMAMKASGSLSEPTTGPTSMR